MDHSQEPYITNEPHRAPGVTRNKRPFSVTVLIVGVLLSASLNVFRFILSISYYGFLSSRLAVSPIYLAMTGCVWGLAGLALVWGLWRGKSWSPRLTLAMALTYALYFWLDQLFLAEHPVSGAPLALGVVLPSNWAFSAGATVITLGYIAWVTNRSKVKLYFGISDSNGKPSAGADNDGRSTKNQQ